MSNDSPTTAEQWQVAAAERYRAGDLDGAAAALKTAARLAPDRPDYPRNLAELARAAGRWDEARAWLETATALTGPQVADLNLLAAAWLDLGAPDRALPAAMRALEDGGDAASRGLFVAAVRGAPDPGARGLVARALREGWSRPDVLSRPAIAMLRAAWPNGAAALAGDALLAELLVATPIRDAGLEGLLTAARKGLLLDRNPGADALIAFQARLASQCHLNEYAWSVEPAETQAIEALRARVAAGGAGLSEILNLACYQSLADVPNADALLADHADGPVRAVLDQQITAARQEQALAATIPVITPIRDGTSARVQAQYEQNPYPRWIRAPRRAAIAMDAGLRAELPGADIQPLAERPDALIAGCGTGQHAVNFAETYVAASITAVDLSRASLAYAQRQARAAGRGDIAFAQADLLELGTLGRSFDVIECVGVLHHLADPFEGARRLAGLLRPGGVMKFGLYSARGRAHLAPAKALAKRFSPDADGIRRLRAAIMAARADDPVRAALSAGDFYALSSCRDLLMHVQEHEMDLADVRRTLEETGLTLLGFSTTAEVRADYQRRFPGDLRRTDLDNWQAFEADNPLTFAGMYQFWAQKPG